jgi:glycosyltransferase involved in cell wall biosynthesis
VEAFLPKFLDSLLNQTYKKLEVILVNDGSSDNTGKVINEYVPLLKANGYAVKVVHQMNGGLASAIDYGLKFFTGEFLTWPDPDDWLTPNSIEERVRMFRENPDVGLVRCNAEKIEGETGKSLGFCDTNSDKVYVHKELFSDLAHIRTYFAPVCYMVRSSSFLDVNPKRSIYVRRDAMQNLQMLLPVSHAYKSIQLEKPLAFYLVRKGSLSRSANSPEDVYKWDSVMCEVARQTLLGMSNVDELFMKKLSYCFVRNKLLPAAFRARLKKESLRLLRESGLGKPRMAMCMCIIYVGCSKLSVFLDLFTIRCWTRILNRTFWVVVRS